MWVLVVELWSTRVLIWARHEGHISVVESGPTAGAAWITTVGCCIFFCTFLGYLFFLGVKSTIFPPPLKSPSLFATCMISTTPRRRTDWTDVYDDQRWTTATPTTTTMLRVRWWICLGCSTPSVCKLFIPNTDCGALEWCWAGGWFGATEVRHVWFAPIHWPIRCSRLPAFLAGNEMTFGTEFSALFLLNFF